MTTAGGGHVVLVGMMGAGKTTTGTALASALGRPLADSDAEVEARAGTTGMALAARDGVEALHALEREILLEALAARELAVVTAAASVVDSARCRSALAGAGLVVWLDVPVDELQVRAAAGSHRRPLPRPAAEAVLARRRARFAEVADLHLDGRAPTARLVATVLAALGR